MRDPQVPKVAAGQVWENLDPRVHRRQVRVLSVEGGYAYCTSVDTQKEIRVRVSRFNGRRNGYGHVSGRVYERTLEESLMVAVGQAVEEVLRSKARCWVDSATGQEWSGAHVTKARRAVYARVRRLLGPVLL